MQDVMTITEAARYLGVSRTKIWTLVREGKLTARQNPLDKRERLVPASALRQLRENGRAGLTSRSLPKTVGMFEGPVVVHSDEIEDYLEAHWRPS
jgi:excisionase family DNA binding protein